MLKYMWMNSVYRFNVSSYVFIMHTDVSVRSNAYVFCTQLFALFLMSASFHYKCIKGIPQYKYSHPPNIVQQIGKI